MFTMYSELMLVSLSDDRKETPAAEIFAFRDEIQACIPLSGTPNPVGI